VNVSQPIRIALLDLYRGIDNRGIPSLQRLIPDAGGLDVDVTLDRYDVRGAGDVPGLDYDLFVSSGGPGSPHDGTGTPWEAAYFRWLDALWRHNTQPGTTPKPALFICHSFQMMVRHFAVAAVTERRSESFGVYAVHKTEAGRRDPLLAPLADPFYAADFRHWQAVEANDARLTALDAQILAREKPRPHVDLERAIMGLRIGAHLVGVQFHPEANPDGMLAHFRTPERRKQVIDKVGQADYERILHRLRDPDFLQPTFDHVVPTFLRHAIRVRIGGEPVPVK
jgi:GMP synthase-like glutamine amidotransferase